MQLNQGVSPAQPQVVFAYQIQRERARAPVEKQSTKTIFTRVRLRHLK